MPKSTKPRNRTPEPEYPPEVQILGHADPKNWTVRKRSPHAKPRSASPGSGPSGGIARMPFTTQEEWLNWTAKSIRPIVANVRCNKCGSPAGLPCRNGVYIFGVRPDGTHAQPTMRPWYQAYVHIDRKIVFTYLETERILKEGS